VRQHHRLGVAGRERAAEHGGALQHVEQPHAGVHHQHLFESVGGGLLAARDERHEGLEIGEVLHALAVVEEVGGGDHVDRLLLARVAAPHHDEVVGRAVGQRPQQHAVDHREEGAVGADAEREGQRRQPGDERSTAGQRQGVTDVGSQLFPGHGVSPVRFVEVWRVVRPQRPATPRGEALGGAGDHVVPDFARDLPARRAARQGVEVGEHLGAETPAERGGIREQRDAQQHGAAAGGRTHASAAVSRRARAVASCAARRPASAMATARPRGVRR